MCICAPAVGRTSSGRRRDDVGTTTSGRRRDDDLGTTDDDDGTYDFLLTRIYPTHILPINVA